MGEVTLTRFTGAAGSSFPTTPPRKNHELNDFASDMEALRDEVRDCVKMGPMLEPQGTDLHRLIHVLNQLLAAELVCVLHYMQHHLTAQRLSAPSVAEEFLQHAGQESDHADTIAARIRQLGGKPNFTTVAVTKSNRAPVVPAISLERLIRQDIIAESVAISAYALSRDWLGDADPITQHVLEVILGKLEERADDMLDSLTVLRDWDPFEVGGSVMGGSVVMGGSPTDGEPNAAEKAA